MKVLNDDNLRSVDGGEATILVMPYYRAQLQMYETSFQKLIGSSVTKEQARRVSFATLDSSQGDEADFCIVDLVNTDHPGFTGDESRQCLTLTRSRQAEIVVAGPGMFIGREKQASQQHRAAVLRRLHTVLELEQAVKGIKTCVICEQPGADHDASACTSQSEQANVPCKCCNPKFHAPHNQKTCERILCLQCKSQGHRTSECTAPLPCSRCHQMGHRLDECMNQQSCEVCGEIGHQGFECEVACRHCYAKDHISSECGLQICSRCSEYGHHRNNCMAEPIITCKTCSKTGHMSRDCPNKTCNHCGLPGHEKRNCPQNVIRCHNCLKEGHKAKDCPEEKAKRCSICKSEDHLRIDCDKATCPTCGGAHSKQRCNVYGDCWTKSDETRSQASRAIEKTAVIDSILSNTSIALSGDDDPNDQQGVDQQGVEQQGPTSQHGPAATDNQLPADDQVPADDLSGRQAD